MKKIVLIISVLAILFSGVEKASAQDYIKKIEIDLPKDSVTGLNREAIVTEFYIGWAVSENGDLDSSGQFINIYYYDVVVDMQGNPISGLSEKKVINIKQGTDDFKAWFNSFDTGFRQGILMELNKIIGKEEE